MARASTRTALTLDRFAEIIGINPLHFNQVTCAALPNTTCATVWKQYDWQENDAISRESLAMAIQEAESRIADYLGYSLLPQWSADVRMQTARPAFPELLNLSGRDVQGFRQSVTLPVGQFISGGIEAKTLIDAGAAVVYTDTDNDGYPETATVTVPTTVTDPCEIAVYYPGEDARDEWEVRPLRRVSITGGVATIIMRRQQLVLPELQEAFVPEAVDGDDDANFLDEVDVYRHWNDPQQQAQLMWSPLPYWWGYGPSGGCGCGDSTCVSCVAATQWGCLLGRDYKLGIVHYTPAEWDADNDEYTYLGNLCIGRNPDRLRLWYYAGLQDMKMTCPTLQMSPAWERAVAYYAVTFLDRMICGCSNVEGVTKHWNTDLSLSQNDASGGYSRQVGQRVLDNPFGATRGALAAWDRANLGESARLGRAALL